MAGAEQIRGLWVVRYALSDEHEVNNIIQIAKSLKITDLYVQVRALGYLFGQTPDQSGNTPLSLLIKSAKRENIRVHAWINTLYIWAKDNPPEDKSHIYYKSQNSNLRTAKEQAIPEYGALKKRGIEGYFIDPADQANQLDLKMIISDLIQHYDIDGIHLDYFRYPSLEYSFSPNNRTLFFRQYWFDPINIFTHLNSYQAENQLDRYLYMSKKYKNFLRKQLTGFLNDLKIYIHQNNPDVELSVAVKPDLHVAKNEYFQDWGAWISENICDRVVMMNYDTVITNFMENLKTNLDPEINSKIIVGVSTYNQNFEAVIDRLKIVENDNKAGFAIFSYNYLNEHPVYMNNLVKKYQDIIKISTRY